MTLYFGKKYSDPVFDVKESVEKKATNVIRRLFTKCSRPIFTEKHILLKPAKSYFLRKCYCSKYVNLFLFQSLKTNKKVKKLNVINLVKNTRCLFRAKPNTNRSQTKIQQIQDKLKLYKSDINLHISKKQGYEIGKTTPNKKLAIHKYALNDQGVAEPILSFSMLTTQIKEDILKSFENTIVVNKSNFPRLQVTTQKANFKISNNMFETTKSKPLPIFKAFSCCIAIDKDIIPFFKSKTFTNISHKFNFALILKVREEVSHFSCKMKFSLQTFENKIDIANNLVIQMWHSLKLRYIDFISAECIGRYLFQEKLLIPTNSLNIKTSISTISSFSNSIAGYILPAKKIVPNNRLFKTIMPTQLSLISITNYIYRLNYTLLDYQRRHKHHLKLRLSLFKLKERPHICLLLGLDTTFKINHLTSERSAVKKLAAKIKLVTEKKMTSFNMFKRVDLSFSPLSFWNSIKLYKAYFCLKNTSSFLKTRSHAKYTHKVMNIIRESSNLINNKLSSYLSNLSLKGILHSEIQNSPIELNSNFLMVQSLRLNEQKILAPRHIIKDIMRFKTINREVSKFSLYNENLHTTMLKRRGNPLLNYLFSSQNSKIYFNNNIKTNIKKLSFEVSIKLKFNISNIKQKRTNQLLCNNTHVSRHLENNTVFDMKRYFQFSAYTPKSITNQLNLVMSPNLQQQTNYISQPSIIPPPDWAFLEKPFKCRIRLSPFPFGFPALKYKSFSPIVLLSKQFFDIHSQSSKMISTISNFFTKRSKSFRSPLSLKDPKRWLWSPTNNLIDKTIKEISYVHHSAITFSNINLSKPTNFLFSWEINTKSTIPLSYFRFSSDFEKRALKTIQIDHAKSNQSIIFEKSHYKKNIEKISAVSIQKIILPFSSMKPFYKKGNFSFCSVSNKKKNPVFYSLGIKPEVIKINNGNLLFKIITYVIKSFTHKISSNKTGINLFNSTYKARNRLFFFPWSPEYAKIAQMPCEVFFELEDSQIIPESNISDDTIITQLPDLNKLDPQTINSYQSTTKRIQKTFNFEIQSSDTKHKFSCTNNYIKAIDFDLAICDIHRPSETMNLLAKQNEQTYNLLMNLSSPEVEQFNYYALLTSNAKTINKNIYHSQTFKMDSVHWIILLSSFLSVSEKALRQQTCFPKKEHLFSPELGIGAPKANYYKLFSTSKIPKLSSNTNAKFTVNIPKKKISLKWNSLKRTAKYFSPKHTILRTISSYISHSYNLSLLSKPCFYELNNTNHTQIQETSFALTVLPDKVKKANPNINFEYKQLKQEKLKQLHIPDWFDLSEINSRINLNVSSIIDLEIERN